MVTLFAEEPAEDMSFHERANERLLSMLPADQLKRVFADDKCDIDLEFLGFVGIYEMLSTIVPRHWTVIDLGCAWAPQAFFFRHHEAYIGVDIHDGERFSAPNTVHFVGQIGRFIEQRGAEFDPGNTFAICSYVPPWGGDNMVRTAAAFQNLFTYYPCSTRRRGR